MKGIYIMIDPQLITPEEERELDKFLLSGNFKETQQRCFALNASYATINRYRKEHVEHPAERLRVSQLRILIDLYNQQLKDGEHHAENTII